MMFIEHRSSNKPHCDHSMEPPVGRLQLTFSRPMNDQSGFASGAKSHTERRDPVPSSRQKQRVLTKNSANSSNQPDIRMTDSSQRIGAPRSLTSKIIANEEMEKQKPPINHVTSPLIIDPSRGRDSQKPEGHPSPGSGLTKSAMIVPSSQPTQFIEQRHNPSTAHTGAHINDPGNNPTLMAQKSLSRQGVSCPQLGKGGPITPGPLINDQTFTKTTERKSSSTQPQDKSSRVLRVNEDPTVIPHATNPYSTRTTEREFPSMQSQARRHDDSSRAEKLKEGNRHAPVMPHSTNTTSGTAERQPSSLQPQARQRHELLRVTQTRKSEEGDHRGTVLPHSTNSSSKAAEREPPSMHSQVRQRDDLQATRKSEDSNRHATVLPTGSSRTTERELSSMQPKVYQRDESSRVAQTRKLEEGGRGTVVPHTAEQESSSMQPKVRQRDESSRVAQTRKLEEGDRRGTVVPHSTNPSSRTAEQESPSKVRQRDESSQTAQTRKVEEGGRHASVIPHSTNSFRITEQAIFSRQTQPRQRDTSSQAAHAQQLEEGNSTSPSRTAEREKQPQARQRDLGAQARRQERIGDESHVTVLQQPTNRSSTGTWYTIRRFTGGFSALFGGKSPPVVSISRDELYILQQAVNYYQNEHESLKSLVQGLQHDNQRLKERVDGLEDGLKTINKRCDEQSASNQVLSQSDSFSISDLKHMIQTLNEEIYQASASFGDTIIHREKVPEEDMEQYVAHSKNLLGPLAEMLSEAARRSDEPVHLLLIQVTLQAILVNFCAKKINLWSSEESTNQVLHTLYHEISLSSDQDVSGRWRALTRGQLKPDTSTWLNELTTDLHGVLIAASWEVKAKDDALSFEANLQRIFKAVLDVRTAIGEKITSSNIEAHVTQPGSPFSKTLMEDEYPDDRPEGQPEVVIATTGIGLFNIARTEDGTFVFTNILPSKVVLKSTLAPVLRPRQDGRLTEI